MASVLSFYFIEESDNLYTYGRVLFCCLGLSPRQGPIIFHPTHLLCAFISTVENGMANPITNVDDRP